MNQRYLFGYPLAIWLLATGMAINITGNSFLWPLNTIYITTILNKSMSIAGIVLMLQQGTSVIGSLIGGWLFDRWDAKKTIVSGTIFSSITVFALNYFQDWSIYVGLMLFLGFSNGLVFPSMYAMAGALWPEGGRKAFNIVYVSQNLGVALGSTLGGVVAQVSFNMIFLVNAFTYLIFLLLILFGFKKQNWEVTRGTCQPIDIAPSKSVFLSYRIQFISLMILSFAFVLTWVPYVQWQTSIATYIKTLEIPLSKYTLLWTINGALIVLGQPFIGIVTKKLIKDTKIQLMTGIVIFIAAYLILFNNQAYLGFVIAMIVMTLAEMLVWPAVPAAAAELAPKGKKGLFQGIISSSGAGGRMLGFLAAGVLYDYTTMNNIVLVMISLFVIAGIGFLHYDYRLKGKGVQFEKNYNPKL